MNSAWGSVCDSAGVFTSDEAKVVCRQLGILQVEGKTVTYYWIFPLNDLPTLQYNNLSRFVFLLSLTLIFSPCLLML